MVDTEKIKDALDSFENDDFMAAKDTLSKEIKGHMNDYFKEKLGLKDDVIDFEKDDPNADDV